MIRIPIAPDLREQRLQVSLDGTRYVIRIEWLERVGAWYLHLATAADVPIVTGLRIFGSGYVLGSLADDRRPAGQIMAVSSSTPETPPAWGELGTGRRVQLVFLTTAELLGLWGV